MSFLLIRKSPSFCARSHPLSTAWIVSPGLSTPQRLVHAGWHLMQAVCVYEGEGFETRPVVNRVVCELCPRVHIQRLCRTADRPLLLSSVPFLWSEEASSFTSCCSNSITLPVPSHHRYWGWRGILVVKWTIAVGLLSSRITSRIRRFFVIKTTLSLSRDPSRSLVFFSALDWCRQSSVLCTFHPANSPCKFTGTCGFTEGLASDR